MSKSHWLLPLLLALVLLAGVGCSSDDQPADDDALPTTQQPSAASSSDQQIQELDDAPAVPDVTLETLDGETIALADRNDEVLLINFWATWCAPCRKEIPDLIELQDELGPEGLTVIGVSLDQDGAEAVEPFLDEFDVNYPIVLDPKATLDSEFGGIHGLPMTFVVDAEGQIRYRILGIFPPDEMHSKLTALLEEASSAAPS